MAGRTPIITGVGIVSSAGIGADRFWDGIQSCNNHFREVSLFSTDGLPNKICSEIGPWVAGFDAIDSAQFAESRICSFAVAAQHEAMVRANCMPAAVDRVLVGTTVGDIATQEAGIRRRNTTRDENPMRLRVDLGLRRAVSLCRDDLPVELFLTACSAGNLAVIRACQLIKSGEADVVVAGGAEALSQMAFVGFSRIRGMATQKCRPFSEQRDGMLLGEGAAFLVIEAAEHAAARGAKPLAEIVGIGMSCDAKHPTAPESEGEGIVRAMQSALGKLPPAQVDYVCAHGTGTQLNDAAEARGYANFFEERCPPVSSIKASIGHSLGAASAIELVACVLSIQHQKILPQCGVDGEPTLDLNLPLLAKPERDIDLVINNAFAFWGNNTSVALHRPRDVAEAIAPKPKSPEIFYASASIVADYPVFVEDGAFSAELDVETLNQLDRRFRSRRSAVVIAALERWNDASQLGTPPTPERCGIVLGTETGAGADIERFLSESIEKGDPIVNPALFPWTVHNAAVGAAAIAATCRGPSIVVSSGEQSGRSAIEQSIALLEGGFADFIYCGVFESLGDHFGTIASITALTTRPELLGESYIGSITELDLAALRGGADCVVSWAQTLGICGARATERVY